MMEAFLQIAVFALSAPAGDAADLTAKMQAVYEKTSAYSAGFEQTYTSAAFPEPQRSSGKVFFKKPGLMRWEYEAPEKRLFVCDGTNLYFYEPAQNQVMVSEGVDKTGLSAALSFLFGKGKLWEEFDVKAGKEGDCGEKGDSLLVFNPKKDASAFESLCMALDSKTMQVKESSLADSFGNVNKLRFLSPRIDRKIDEKLFRFEMPKDAIVIKQPQ